MSSLLYNIANISYIFIILWKYQVVQNVSPKSKNIVRGNIIMQVHISKGIQHILPILSIIFL